MRGFERKARTLQHSQTNKPAVANPAATNHSIKSIIKSKTSGLERRQGQSLDFPTGHEMGRLFGHNFDHVRVHTNSSTPGVKASTQNHDIHFAAGEYAPFTRTGCSLLAHELTHVVQQEKSGRITTNSIAEAEADKAADNILHGRAVRVKSSSRPGVAQFKNANSSRPDKTDQVQLFERPGNIISAMIVKNGQEYGYGYVHYPSSMTAEEARSKIGIGKIYDSDGYLVRVDLLLPQELAKHAVASSKGNIVNQESLQHQHQTEMLNVYRKELVRYVSELADMRIEHDDKLVYSPFYQHFMNMSNNQIIDKLKGDEYFHIWMKKGRRFDAVLKYLDNQQEQAKLLSDSEARMKAMYLPFNKGFFNTYFKAHHTDSGKIYFKLLVRTWAGGAQIPLHAFSGMTLEPDEFVNIINHEQGGKIVSIRAKDLVEMSDEYTWDTLENIGVVTIGAGTVLYAGISGGFTALDALGLGWDVSTGFIREFRGDLINDKTGRDLVLFTDTIDSILSVQAAGQVTIALGKIGVRGVDKLDDLANKWWKKVETGDASNIKKNLKFKNAIKGRISKLRNLLRKHRIEPIKSPEIEVPLVPKPDTPSTNVKNPQTPETVKSNIADDLTERRLIEESRHMAGKIEPHYMRAELNYLKKNLHMAQPSDMHNYSLKIDIGNGHAWHKAKGKNSWCRHSAQLSMCGTKIEPDGMITLPPDDIRFEYAGNVDNLPRNVHDKNIEPLKPGTGFEMEGGHWVWRDKNGDIFHESLVGDSLPQRKSYENQFYSANEAKKMPKGISREQENNLKKARKNIEVLEGMERSHSLGRGTGFESPYGLYYAPRTVNQDLQNHGIELFLRKLNTSLPPNQRIKIATRTRAHGYTNRLKEIFYKAELKMPDGSRVPLFEYKINVTGGKTPTVSDAIVSVGDSTILKNLMETMGEAKSFKTKLRGHINNIGN